MKTNKSSSSFSAEFIRSKLETDNRWLFRGIVAIFEYQTNEEKMVHVTKEQNNVGFNSVDASFLSSLAEKIIKGYSLSEKQISCARKAMLKYSNQLFRISEMNR